MQTQPAKPPVDPTNDSIGPAAAAHLDLVWRHMMKSHGSFENEQYFRLVTGLPHPLGNISILREADDARVVEEAVAPLMDLPTPAAVLFVAGVGDAVAGELTARGFSMAGAMPAMAVDIPSLAPTVLPAGYEFFKIASGEDGVAWTDAVAAGFVIPRGLARLMSPEVQGASPDPDAATQYFGIRRMGRLVATSMLYLANGLAGIYCVSTMPEERGRGLGAHVTAEALRVAREAGYGVGVLQSSAAGHSVYLALGFRDVGSVSMFMRIPG